MGMHIPADIGNFRHSRASFYANGPRKVVGSNPIKWQDDETWAARFFVGLDVKVNGESVPRYSLEDVLEFVVDVRNEQGADPSSSYIAQRGVFRHCPDKDSQCVVAREHSVQVVIIAPTGETPKQFRQNMLQLAEALAVQFEQEEVILQVQKNGIQEQVYGVTG